MAIFGKLAYEDGVSTLTLLFVRFGLATVIFGVLLARRPATAQSLRGAGRRTLAIGLGLGAIGYATQAGLFFAALQRLDASLLALVLYTFPAWVMLGSFALGRERRRAGASWRSRCRPPGSSSCSPARPRAPSTPPAWRWASARRSRTRCTSSSPIAPGSRSRRSR